MSARCRQSPTPASPRSARGHALPHTVEQLPRVPDGEPTPHSTPDLIPCRLMHARNREPAGGRIRGNGQTLAGREVRGCAWETRPISPWLPAPPRPPASPSPCTCSARPELRSGQESQRQPILLCSVQDVASLRPPAHRPQRRNPRRSPRGLQLARHGTSRVCKGPEPSLFQGLRPEANSSRHFLQDHFPNWTLVSSGVPDFKRYVCALGGCPSRHLATPLADIATEIESWASMSGPRASRRTSLVTS